MFYFYLIFSSAILFSDRSTNIADFIQPSLGQLQPNLDEFMDTIEPLQGKHDNANTKYFVYSIRSRIMD